MQNRDYNFSLFLSYILHPLLIPTLVTSALMMRSDLYSIVLPVNMKLWITGVVFAFTVVIPGASVLILLKFKAIQSHQLHERGERTLPLLIASSSFLALLYSLKSAGLPPVFLYVLYSAAFALLTGLLINLAYKISLHTLGWGALAATLTGISIRTGLPMLTFITVSIMLSGFAGYARLKQNAHNQTQVYLGYVAGVSIILLISYFG